MNTFGFFLCLGLVALSTARPGYRYDAPADYAGEAAASSPSASHVKVEGAASASQPVVLEQSAAAASPTSSVVQFGSFQSAGTGQVRSASVGQGPVAGQVSFVTQGATAGQGIKGGAAVAKGSIVGQGAVTRQGVIGGQSAVVGPAVGQVNLVGVSGQGFGSSQGFAAGSSAQAQGAFQAGGQAQTIITKDFYIHSAPEEQEETISTGVAQSGPAHKNYRIVFIKTPSPKFTVSSAAISGALNEEKTVIYVLAKRPDLNVIQQQVAQHAQKASKPEVFFIKYQTPEEAQLAQQEIKAQYDALGGETRVSDEGVAPVHSVIGRAGGASASSGASSASSSGFSVGAVSDARSGFAASDSVSGSGSISSGSAVGSGFGSGVSSGISVVSGSNSDFGSSVSYNAGAGSDGQAVVEQIFEQAASSDSVSAEPSPEYLPAEN